MAFRRARSCRDRPGAHRLAQEPTPSALHQFHLGALTRHWQRVNSSLRVRRCAQRRLGRAKHIDVPETDRSWIVCKRSLTTKLCARAKRGSEWKQQGRNRPHVDWSTTASSSSAQAKFRTTAMRRRTNTRQRNRTLVGRTLTDTQNLREYPRKIQQGLG